MKLDLLSYQSWPETKKNLTLVILLDVSTCIPRLLSGLHVQIYSNSWELKFVREYGDPSRNVFKRNGAVTHIVVTSILH
jgi:hypothetical protein